MLPALKPLAALILRPYQCEAEQDVYDAWDMPGVLNVLLVLPTGAGKTATFSVILHKHIGKAIAIAHRQELVLQISMALARDGVIHKIIAPKPIIKMCVNAQLSKFGKQFYSPNADIAVAGVDTLIRKVKDPEFMAWAKGVTLWVQDEAHHLLDSNKWGTAADMFPNAKGLGVTATPTRADGKGLGRHSDGLFDVMVEGPTMRELIDMAYLTDYRIVAPKTSDLNLADVAIGSGGEFVKSALKKAVRKSRLVGDVVKHYIKFAKGRKGVTFASDLESAQDICNEFNSAGIPAVMVHGESSDFERQDAVKALEEGRILQLVNVDLFGEGFDLPTIEVVSMARPTKSYSLFVQQFGRALRLLVDPALMERWDSFTVDERKWHILNSTKPKALIIDHVGNTDLLAGGHGLPDAVREWTLDGRTKGRSTAADDVIPTRTCLRPDCLSVYERTHRFCPYCGHHPEPAERTGPEYVDGDLTELSPETLAKMRGEVDKLNRTPEEYETFLKARGMKERWRGHAVEVYTEKHAKDMGYQEILEANIAWWAGVQRSKGRTDNESMRRFYYTFGVDLLSAKALGAADALMLADKIVQRIGVDYG